MAKKTITEESRLQKVLSRVLAKKKFVFIGIIVVMVIQFLQVQALFAYFYQLELRDSSLITEIGDVKGAYVSFATDVNEIRDYLRLPKKEYDGFDDPALELDEDSNENDLQLAIFAYAEYLASQKTVQESVVKGKGMLQGLIDSENISKNMADAGLKIALSQNDAEKFKVSVLNENDTELFNYHLDLEDGVMYQSTPLAEEAYNFKNSDFAKFEKEFLTFSKENSGEILTALKNSFALSEKMNALLASESAKTIIAEKNIQLAEPTNSLGNSKYSFQNKEGEEIGSVSIQIGKADFIAVDGEGKESKITLKNADTQFTNFLKTLDTLTLIEKKVAKAKNQMESTLNDKGFKLLLSTSGLKIPATPREDDIRIYYDIQSEDGTALSSIVIEKTTGVINIVQADGTNSENILFFSPETKKKL